MAQARRQRIEIEILAYEVRVGGEKVAVFGESQSAIERFQSECEAQTAHVREIYMISGEQAKPVRIVGIGNAPDGSRIEIAVATATSTQLHPYGGGR